MRPRFFSGAKTALRAPITMLRAAGMNLVPFIVPLAFGQMAVQHRDCVLRFGETALEAFDRLRRERNLRNENDCCASAVERGADRLQVNFRFASASDAVEQNRARVLGRVEGLEDFLQRALFVLRSRPGSTLR